MAVFHQYRRAGYIDHCNNGHHQTELQIPGSTLQGLILVQWSFIIMLNGGIPWYFCLYYEVIRFSGKAT